MENLIFSNATPADSVLSDYELCQTPSLEEACLWGKRIFCDNRIYSRDQHFKAHIYYRRLGGVGIGRIGYGADTVIDAGVMEEFALIQMPIRGQELVESGAHRVRCTPRQGVVMNAHMRTLIHHSENTEKLIIRVDRELIRHLCQQHLGRTLRKEIEFSPEMPLNTAHGRRWMHMVGWMYDCLSVNEQVPPLLRAQLEQTLVGMLLTCQPHNYSAELCEDDSPSVAPAFVKRVERYIEEHADAPITIGDLAEQAGVSSRSLFTGFRRYRNTTPMHYLKEVRLRRVHEELRQAQPSSGTVTAIAFRWGFSHLGHFTTDYKRRFGESPSETLMR